MKINIINFAHFKKIFISFKNIYQNKYKESDLDTFKEIYFILVPGGNANKFIFEVYQRVLSNYGYVINGNYLGVLNEQKYYKQVLEIYNYLKSHNKRVVLVGHSAGSNLILNIKLNEKLNESFNDIYFLLAMNTDVIDENIFVINGIFDEMHPMPETIKITKQNYYLTFTNHIGQLSDFNTIYYILTFINKNYKLYNKDTSYLNDFNLIMIKEFLIYIFTIFLFTFLLYFFYFYNSYFSVHLLILMFFYLIFRIKFALYDVNFIISAIILSYLFFKTKIDIFNSKTNYIIYKFNFLKFLINFEVLVLSFIFSLFLANLFILFIFKDIHNIKFNVFSIFISLLNLILGLNYHLVKTIGNIYWVLFFILILILIFDKINYDNIYINYVNERLKIFKDGFQKLDLIFIISFIVLVVVLINIFNLVLFYLDLDQMVFDLFRFFQFILRILLTVLLFISYLKLISFKKFNSFKLNSF